MTQGQKNLEVIATLGLMEGKEEALSLVPYLSASGQEALKHILGELSETPPEEHLKALQAGDQFTGLAEIHPAWLLDILKEESPRVIGVILRYLPSKHVRFLLEHLPKRVTMKLPNLIEAFYVPAELLDVIRQRIERHFVPMGTGRQPERFQFENIHDLKIEDLESLFYDLGLSELALSLIDSPKQVLKIILNRFTIRDAKEVLKRVQRFQAEPVWFMKDAKFSVFSAGGEESGPSGFLKGLGFVSLAKAIDDSQADLFMALRQKMAPERAYLFKRYWDESKRGSSAEKRAKRKEWILKHIEQGGTDER